MNRLRLILLITLLCVVGAGCWDRREIEERSTVLVLGIDPATKPSPKGNLLTLSAQIAIPGGIPLGGSGQGGAQAGGPSVEILASTGESVQEALSNLQKRLNQKEFLGHTRVIAIAEELARQGLGRHLDAFRRNPEIRRLLWLVVVREKARGLVTFTPKLEQVPAFYLMNMFDNDVRLGRMANVFLGEFLIRRSNGGEDAVLPLIEVIDGDLQRKGVAVFRDDTMIGSLTSEEEWTLLQARGIPTATEEARIELPEGSVTAMLSTRRRKMSSIWNGDQLSIHLKITLEGNVSEALGRVNLGDPKVVVRIGDAFSKKLNREITALIKKTQDWNTDIVGFGEYVRAFEPGKWRRLNWMEMYPTVSIKVETEVFIRRIGMGLGK